MGVTWTAEVVTWFLSGTNRPAPETALGVFNALNIFQGVLVFVVVAGKRSVWENVGKELGLVPERFVPAASGPHGIIIQSERENIFSLIQNVDL